MSIRPEDYRHLEVAVREYLTVELGLAVILTGQEHVGGALGRWSPDMWCNAGMWVDAKVRHHDYGSFLIEDADLQRHTRMFRPTVYVLVADDPVLELAGWITAEEALRNAGERRTDHVRPGSGDAYRLIDAVWLRPMYELERIVRRGDRLV